MRVAWDVKHICSVEHISPNDRQPTRIRVAERLMGNGNALSALVKLDTGSSLACGSWVPPTQVPTSRLRVRDVSLDGIPDAQVPTNFWSPYTYACSPTSTMMITRPTQTGTDVDPPHRHENSPRVGQRAQGPRRCGWPLPLVVTSRKGPLLCRWAKPHQPITSPSIRVLIDPSRSSRIKGKCAPQVGQFQDVQCSRNLTRLYTSSSARLMSVSFKRFNAQDISRVFTRAIAAKWYCKEAGLVVRYI